jgi:hypothetical protein
VEGTVIYENNDFNNKLILLILMLLTRFRQLTTSARARPPSCVAVEETCSAGSFSPSEWWAKPQILKSERCQKSCSENRTSLTFFQLAPTSVGRYNSVTAKHLDFFRASG